jgi:signal transduction histidine kinase
VADAETERELLRRMSGWFAAVRLLAVPVAVLQVFFTDFPPGYRGWALASCGILAVGAVALLALSMRDLTSRQRRRLAEVALVFDTAVVFAFVFAYSFLDGSPAYSLFFLPVLEAALQFGVVGGVGLTVAATPLLAAAELFRASRFNPEEFRVAPVAVRAVVGLVLGTLAGRLVTLLVDAMRQTDARAAEAEQLRDELGRRVDVLEAANRCARALASSLELEQAFGAFIRELRGLVPFERTAIVLAEDGSAQVMATAGHGAETVYAPATSAPVAGTVLEEVLRGQLVVRDDLLQPRYTEEEALAELGLRCQLAAPLLLGARAIGMLAILREKPRSFTAEEIELVTLLGRLVATAVQNIRAYEAERSTVEELRRLSTLRADFVSLVSHELRSPMAAVIGAARTLEQRWRELTPEQRESFLALIGDETTRLAELISDVLDTSRIEAGTFSYSFSDVDVGSLAREIAAAAGLGQDEVEVTAEVREPVPRVRGDADRLRQVLRNLVENAVKYSPAGDNVGVTVYAHGGRVLVDVADSGPGIAREHQRLIFEKFGRARSSGGAKPGTGLGLFIARSIAEAHGGTLEVRSTPERGSTFTLALPAAA